MLSLPLNKLPWFQERLLSSFLYYLVLHGGFITKAGAVCLELLTPQGWVGGYTIESIIVQLAVTLVQGEARINFSALPKNIYTLQGKVHRYLLYRLFSPFRQLC